jgi:hypothetical protein
LKINIFTLKINIHFYFENKVFTPKMNIFIQTINILPENK